MDKTDISTIKSLDEQTNASDSVVQTTDNISGDNAKASTDIVNGTIKDKDSKSNNLDVDNDKSNVTENNTQQSVEESKDIIDEESKVISDKQSLDQSLETNEELSSQQTKNDKLKSKIEYSNKASKVSDENAPKQLSDDDINNQSEDGSFQDSLGDNKTSASESDKASEPIDISKGDDDKDSQDEKDEQDEQGEKAEQEEKGEQDEQDDTANKGDNFVVDNIDDSQLLADEVGISGQYDVYGREILEPVFENILRLSKNSIKLTYSRLKNTILGYRDIKQRYSGAFELFKKSNKILCRMEIGDDCINIYYALNFDELDSEKFVFYSAKGQYKLTSTRVTISIGDEKSGDVYLTAMSFIEKVMAENKIERNRTYVPTAYAERYPFNPNAVLSGKQDTPPDEEHIEDKQYDYIEGELSKNIIEELMGESFNLDDKRGKDKLTALRQQASTIKGAVAITEPIIYFYDSALNKENNSAYLNVQQVLQDKFLGKMLPQQYFAVAESSSRIEHLNFLAVEQAVENCNDNANLNFCVKISCRLLTKGNSFDRLLKSSKTDNNNLIMAFDCSLLEVLGQEGMAAIEMLKENGVKIMLDNTESAGLKILTEYVIDYLRFDARYYKEENIRTTAHLDMLTSYCNVQGIATASINVDTNKQAKHFMSHGVDIIQGYVIEEPKRTIAGAVKEAKRLAVIN